MTEIDGSPEEAKKIYRAIYKRGGTLKLARDRVSFRLEGTVLTDEETTVIGPDGSLRQPFIRLIADLQERNRALSDPQDAEDLKVCISAEFDETKDASKIEAIWKYFDAASLAAFQGLSSNPSYLDAHNQSDDQIAQDALRRAVALTRARFQF
jgi:hypothetical protein